VLLDDAAALGELGDVGVQRHVGALQPHGPNPLCDLGRLGSRARRDQAGQVDEGVAGP
jgi:hypothetical protein